MVLMVPFRFFLPVLLLLASSSIVSLVHCLVIGTRGSPLALAQANQVKHLLHTRCGIDNKDILINIINTKGDSILNQALTDIGGKGLFTRELDEALVKGEVDLVVHSMKDLPVALREGTRVAAVLEREETNDVMIVRRKQDNNNSNSDNSSGLSNWLKGLRDEVIVGTASLRRQAQLLQRHRELGLQSVSRLRVVNFRGNVQTRLKKLESGVVDATLLAVAGLNRLGMTTTTTTSEGDLLGLRERGIDSFVVDKDELLPAVAQGAVAVQCRDPSLHNNKDARTLELLLSLNHRATHLAVSCERAFLDALDGNCRTPIAGQATFDLVNNNNNSSKELQVKLLFRGLISKPDGSDMRSVMRELILPTTTKTTAIENSNNNNNNKDEKLRMALEGIEESVLLEVGAAAAKEIRDKAGHRFSEYAASFQPQPQHE